MVVFFGLFQGLAVLPVLLSLIGPELNNVDIEQTSINVENGIGKINSQEMENNFEESRNEG